MWRKSSPSLLEAILKALWPLPRLPVKKPPVCCGFNGLNRLNWPSNNSGLLVLISLPVPYLIAHTLLNKLL
jgi:hypothetical protein